MDIDSAFEADAQLAHACEPGVSAHHYSAMAPHAVAALNPPERDARRHASLLELMAAAVDIVDLVGVQFA